MTCADARLRLLTADPAELAGGTGGELSLHIATCASCRARATLVLEAQAELANALDAPVTPRATDAVRRALAVASRRRDTARRSRVWIPAAAAAVIAGAMVIRFGGHSTEPPSPPLAPPATARMMRVTPPPGRSVAVWHTDDPNVVVIWFF